MGHWRCWDCRRPWSEQSAGSWHRCRAVNIQHIESLNDVVAQITRVRVRETVPDSIIDRADDIELVDL
ncbi:MAG: hypothetical protein G4V63_26740, partial [Candidatus Afipia apatlaquensis]|nr:hypothetical protein [Candidatus Afipia apatlaquensis]